VDVSYDLIDRSCYKNSNLNDHF